MAWGGVPSGVDLSSSREGVLDGGNDVVGVPDIEEGGAGVEGDTD